MEIHINFIFTKVKGIGKDVAYSMNLIEEVTLRKALQITEFIIGNCPVQRWSL